MGRGTRNLLIGCGLIVTLLCVCVIGVAVLTGGAIGALFGLLQAPYGIADRPLPASSLADVILPPSVGSFTRGQIGQAAGGGLQAVYEGGGTQVRVRAAQYPSVGDAQAQVALAASQTQGGSQTYVTGTDPSYVRAGSRLAWSHGRYFFDVQASSDADLDRFMAVFPY